MTHSQNTYMRFSPSGQVPRTALIHKIKTRCAGRHIYITAPGGYGKTVAVSQWLATVRGNKAKLILDSSDNVPGFFYKRLAAVLLKLTGRADTAGDVAISFDKLMEIIGQLPAKGKRCYLVIDDINMITNEEIIRRMPVLAGRLPGYIRCCIINCFDPSPAFLKTGLFGIITKDDLVFSDEEIEWLGIEKGVELSGEQIRNLQSVTGGWAMYLHALLSSGNIAGDTAAAAHFPVITQYIDSLIWEQTRQDRRNILLRLAIPEMITPDLSGRLVPEENGGRLLREISKDGNSFLSLTGTDKNTYKFHDIYRRFLLGKAAQLLPENELRRLNDAAGQWHYERGEYYEGARHFIQNKDHDGITRCLSDSLRFLKENAHISVEVRLGFARQCLNGLPEDFISENLYLIVWRASAAFYDGDTQTFCKYIDLLYERVPDIKLSNPDILQTFIFVSGLDYRVTLLRHCRTASKLARQPAGGTAALPSAARISSVTQNLPFFHRSMRDHSELHLLNPDDLRLVSGTYGIAIGKDYKIMETAVISGIHYEKGEMIKALHYALSGYNAITREAHPETYFCSHMMLAAVLHSTGARHEARIIMDGLSDYIENEARFLIPNFKAVKTMWDIRAGDTDAAREWLDINAYKSPGKLPFYQLCRHFATLRSFIAAGGYRQAADFGQRLYALAINYKRPLDQAESLLLTAIALERGGDEKRAGRLFMRSLETAEPYGFTQVFVNEGYDILPMLRQLRDNRGVSCNTALFAAQVADIIHSRLEYKTGNPGRAAVSVKLSQRQRMLLTHLDSGLTYTQIAAITGIERATVKYHLLTSYKKLGVHDGAEAVLRAKELGLL